MSPTASLIILTYNSLEYTRLCLESIFAETDGPDYEVILVDNASGEETRAYLQQFAAGHPACRLILNERNLGFARGNNQGAAAAQGDYLVFLNNDTVVTSGWLSGLISHLQDPTVGMVGPVTNRIGNEARIRVDYEAEDLAGMQAFAARQARSQAGRAFEIRMLALFCAALRRSVFEAVGPLDERFGVGMFEDDDYSLRLRQAGYRLLCAEDVFVHHWGSAGFAQIDFARWWGTFEENRKKLEDKWGRPWIPPRSRDELLDEQLAEQAGERARLAAWIIELQHQNAELNETVYKLQTELNDIRYSRGWRLLQRFYRLGGRLLPTGSPQARALERAVLGARALYRGVRGRRAARESAERRASMDQQMAAILAQHAGKRVVVFVPSIHWRVPLFQRPHQLAMAFARQGCLVFFWDPPDEKAVEPGIHLAGEGLYVANVPPEIFAPLRAPILFTLAYNRDYIRHFDSPCVVYEYIDELSVFPGEPQVLRQNHDHLVRTADLVAVSADKLMEEVAPLRPDALLSPNAVDFDFIRRVIAETEAPPAEIAAAVAAGRPIVGYYGALAKWFDYRLLARAAAERPDYLFLLIGPEYDNSLKRSDLGGAQNILLLGPRPYPELPRYLKYFDVAVIPFLLNEVTHATSPLKLFEYMTAGKPVVTTAMRECRKYPVVLAAADELEFIALLDRALTLREDSEYQAALERTARQNTWDERARAILQALEEKIH